MDIMHMNKDGSPAAGILVSNVPHVENTARVITNPHAKFRIPETPAYTYNIDSAFLPGSDYICPRERLGISFVIHAKKPAMKQSLGCAPTLHICSTARMATASPLTARLSRKWNG